MHSGQRVLVNGAGGGAGSFAVQLARRRGAEVTAVDAGEKLEMLRGLGAHHVIDYRQTDYTATGETYDFVLDFEVHRPLSHCRRALAEAGRLTIVGGDLGRIAATLPYGLLVRLTSAQRLDVLLHCANAGLESLGALAADGSLSPVIEREYPLAEAPEAMRRLADGRIIGKAVLVMD